MNSEKVNSFVTEIGYLIDTEKSSDNTDVLYVLTHDMKTIMTLSETKQHIHATYVFEKKGYDVIDEEEAINVMNDMYNDEEVLYNTLIIVREECCCDDRDIVEKAQRELYKLTKQNLKHLIQEERHGSGKSIH